MADVEMYPALAAAYPSYAAQALLIFEIPNQEYWHPEAPHVACRLLEDAYGQPEMVFEFEDGPEIQNWLLRETAHWWLIQFNAVNESPPRVPGAGYELLHWRFGIKTPEATLFMLMHMPAHAILITSPEDPR